MKINDKLDISIKNYLGKLEKGVVVLLSIIYDGNPYEGTYWYDNDYKVLTLDEELSEVLGDITKHSEYENIMRILKKDTSDFDEIYETLQEIN